MRKTLFALALAAFLLAACTGRTSKKEAEAREAAEIERIDSIKTEMNTVKTEIDSSVATVDELINDL
ncbi:MAG: hypothetical protein A2Y87_08920 [Bacteroidetes bacterium RBG_13_46_8]|nr:MAG: hypothetical protein A2Y87_08920 [Bacteroidetes bacterium RBG_13_46_8]